MIAQSREGQPRIHSDEDIRRYHREGLWGSRLLVDFVDEHAGRTPDKCAIAEARGKLTYGEVARQSENLAASLLRLGVRRGDVVAVQAPNWAEMPIVHMATDRIGAIFLPLSEGFRERELQHILGRSRVKAIFCPELFRGFAHRAQIERLRMTLPDLGWIISLRGESVSPEHSYERMAADERWRSETTPGWLSLHRADADAPSHVMVSSGTTGLPRCSLFSDNNTIVKLLRHYVQSAQVSKDDIAAAFAPAGTGATGYNYPILAMLLLGGTSVMLEHWSGSNVTLALDVLERNACTIAVMVPAQLARLVQAPGLERRDFSALRVITNSGSKLPPSVAESAERLFGCKVQGIYGSSEAGATAMTSVADPDEKRRTTVGRPLLGQEVRIAADDRTSLGAEEIGEVCWRGANKSYGFLNDPEQTTKVWGVDGWLCSGDLGLIDRDGYLHIVGRKKDMIIRGGQNVNPGALEEILLRHPSVSEVAVVPFDDPVLGERIAACIVPRQGAVPTLESLKNLILANGLAAWNQPELIVPMTDFPRNAGGKIDKGSLSKVATAAAIAGGANVPA